MIPTKRIGQRMDGNGECLRNIKVQVMRVGINSQDGTVGLSRLLLLGHGNMEMSTLLIYKVQRRYLIMLYEEVSWWDDIVKGIEENKALVKECMDKGGNDSDLDVIIYNTWVEALEWVLGIE